MLLQYIDEFFSTLTIDPVGNQDRNHRFFIRQTIESFLEDENKDTALRVYMAVIYAYGFSEKKSLAYELLELLRNYEENTSTLVERHRDHFVHSVNVFLLGLSFYARNAGLRSRFREDFQNGRFYSTDQGEFFFRWGLAALFHDIGYPIELISKQLKKLFRYMADVPGGSTLQTEARVMLVNFEDFNTIDNWRLKEEETYFPDRESDGSFDPLKILDLLAWIIHEKQELDYVPLRDLLLSFPEKMQNSGLVDHGFYSAFIVMRWFATQIFQNQESSKAFIPVVDSASAILLHNYYRHVLRKAYGEKGPLSPSRNPLAFLMILCDELQEWNRAAYGEVMAKDFEAEMTELLIDDALFSIRYRITLYDQEGETLGKAQGFQEGIEGAIVHLLRTGELFPEGFCLQVEITETHFEREPIRMQLRQFNANIEVLAKGIHARFLEDMAKKGRTTPATVPFDQLADEFVMHNYRHANGIVDKLALINCVFVGEELDVPAVEEFSSEEVEVLAIREHHDWKKEHARLGWVYGPVRDDRQRVHPDFVSWEELREEVREFDRESVRYLIPLLRKIGLKIHRNPKRP